MKAQELMIGDLVHINVGYYDTETKLVTASKPMPVKVSAIGEGLVQIDMLDGRYKLCEYAEINPIPLTPEILEKNFQGTADYFIELERYDRAIEGMDAWIVNIQTKTTAFASVIRYLHELQHALKLCNIEKEIEL